MKQTFYAYPCGRGKASREIFGGVFKDGGFVSEDDGKVFNVVFRKTKNYGYLRYLVNERGVKIYEVH